MTAIIQPPTDVMDPYRPGFVVVRRTWQPIRAKGSKRVRHAYTLHREDCDRLQGSRPQPAPVEPYPDTRACTNCRPEDPHHYLYERRDGRAYGRCTLCDITTEAPSLRGCQTKMRVAHAARAASAEMAAALAAGLTVSRVMVPVEGGVEYRLHRTTCAVAGRSRVARPVIDGDDLPASVVGCHYCDPPGVPENPAPRTPKRARSNQAPPGLDPAQHRQVREFRGTEVRLSCSCGRDSGFRSSQGNARLALRRMHASGRRGRDT